MARQPPIAPPLGLPPDWTPLVDLIPALEAVLAKLQAAYRQATATPFQADISRADDPLTGWDEPRGLIADWSTLLAESCARGRAEVRPSGALEPITFTAEDWRSARFTRSGGLVHPLLPSPWENVEVRARTAPPGEQPAPDDVVMRARVEADDVTLAERRRRAALYFAAWAAEGFRPTRTAKEANARARRHYSDHLMLTDDRRRQQEAWRDARGRSRS